MNQALEIWKEKMLGYTRPGILVTGTKRWEGSPIEDHSIQAPHGIWVGTDIASGEGVDVVADLCEIDKATERRFEGIFSPATLEHVARPWLAMKAMADVLVPGGSLFLQTHQTFPLHGYPHDYFRFSCEALKILALDAGLHSIVTCYEYPCYINPPPEITRWNTAAHCYLNVCICATK